ncbi:MAG: M48 family metallopeptidase [Rhodocyclaceae bacterium]|nr:M48 family metallopeptidase [Rhodocyclaceae bacterium]
MGMFDWIVRAGVQDASARLLPQRIDLPAIDSAWEVDWRPGAAPGLEISRLRSRVALGHPRALDAIGGLQHWLKLEARRHLPDWLALVAKDTGHRYQRVSVRLQRSRWGSCSSRGTISLNAKLLMLPPDAVRYVLVHELCHTLHMNHSRAFWDEVTRHQPDWARQARQIRALQRGLPTWTNVRAG